MAIAIETDASEPIARILTHVAFVVSGVITQKTVTSILTCLAINGREI